jgi:hypothetical protein
VTGEEVVIFSLADAPASASNKSRETKHVPGSSTCAAAIAAILR